MDPILQTALTAIGMLSAFGATLAIQKRVQRSRKELLHVQRKLEELSENEQKFLKEFTLAYMTVNEVRQRTNHPMVLTLPPELQAIIDEKKAEERKKKFEDENHRVIEFNQ